MNGKTTRRQFLKFLTAAASGTIVACARVVNTPWVRGLAEDLGGKVYLPVLGNSTSTQPPQPTATDPPPQPTETDPPPSGTPLPPPTGPRVVHVHSNAVTSWNGSPWDYWNYVDQGVMDNMVDQGMMALTGASSVADAWRAILPNYQPGQGIAIKANLNNSQCHSPDGEIDALIQPVNSMVRGMKLIGVQESDIWVYDAIRSIPDRFASEILFNGVRFFDKGCYNEAGFSSSNSSAFVSFNPPSGIPMPPPIRITDMLINATYLIDMPILKYHGGATGASLAFKNHFGTINNPDALHDYVGVKAPYFRTDYSPFVDIYMNPNVGPKTILIMSDGIFGAKRFKAEPTPWATFANQVPKSLFFSTDPVANDSVMFDFVAAEMGSMPTGSDAYMQVAMNAGLGVYENGDPWGAGYNQIDYQRINL